MTILRIKRYLTDTVNSIDHARATEMKTVLDALATEKNSQITTFEVQNGEVTVGASSPEALKHIEDSLKALEGVDVHSLSQLQAQLERNRVAQESIDRRREKKQNGKQSKVPN
jgi:hypothetical protein